MTEDLDKLFGVPPGHQLHKAPADLGEKIWKEIEAHRDRKKWNRRIGSMAAAAAISGVAYLAYPLVQKLVPVATIKPPVSAPAASSVKTPPAAAQVTPQPNAPTHKAPHLVGHRAPAKKELEPPKIVSAPGTMVPETTETFPAPPPEIQPYRPNVVWAAERTGSDGEPVTTTRPPVFRRKGLPRTTPPPPAGTPRVHENITVTAPPTTTTTSTQAPESPQPPTRPQQ